MKFVLPVEYSVYGTITVEDDSIKNVKDAIDYFNKNKDDIELPDNPEYIEDSFKLNDDNPEFIEWLNKNQK